MPNVVRVLRALHAGVNAARGPQPPPVPHFGTGRTARVAKVALGLGIAAVALVAVDAPGALPHAWVPYYRLGSAIVLLPVGTWLMLRARRRRSLRGLRARTIERTLELGGSIMLLVGALELALALVHLL